MLSLFSLYIVLRLSVKSSFEMMKPLLLHLLSLCSVGFLTSYALNQSDSNNLSKIMMETKLKADLLEQQRMINLNLNLYCS